MELSNVGSPWMLGVIIVGILLFGANRIPDLFRGLGEGMKEFKKATRETDDEEKPSPPPSAAAPTEARDRSTGSGAAP